MEKMQDIPNGMPYIMAIKCREWYLSHPGREPTYQDYKKWWDRTAEWEEERIMNEMDRLSVDNEDKF